MRYWEMTCMTCSLCLGWGMTCMMYDMFPLSAKMTYDFNSSATIESWVISAKSAVHPGLYV